MAAIAPFISSTTPRPTRLVDTLYSEWVKLTTLRSTYLTLALGLVLSIASSALVGLAIASTQDTWSADFHPVTISMFGNIFALITYSVFGVLVMTREYSSGLVRVTLAGTPARGRVLFTKLALVGLIILVLGIFTTVGMFLAGQAVLGAYGYPTTNLADPDARRMVFGLGATMAFFPIMGLLFGAVLRSTAGAITAVLGLLWLPVIFGETLPMWWRENVISLLPGSALDSLSVSHVEPAAANTDPAVAAIIAGVWLAVMVGAAYLTLVRRDA